MYMYIKSKRERGGRKERGDVTHKMWLNSVVSNPIKPKTYNLTHTCKHLNQRDVHVIISLIKRS